MFRVIESASAVLASPRSFPNILIFRFVSSFILIGHYLQNIQPLTIEQTLDSGNEINARRGLHNQIQIDTQQVGLAVSSFDPYFGSALLEVRFPTNDTKQD